MSVGRLLAALVVIALLAGVSSAQHPSFETFPASGAGLAGVDTGCMSCHSGTEEMHPWLPLSCTDCHGGDGQATTIDDAHVAPRLGWPSDERVLPEGFDPDAVRFVNPSDMRVLDTTCGRCHAELVGHLHKSLHGTTAGHLCDGLYENGVTDERESGYGVFGVTDDDGDLGAHGLASLDGIGELRLPRRPDSLGDHFIDLPRKQCMQCHLYSEGVAVRGRLGHDGLHRGDGCSACHVVYGEDGRSHSGDPTVDKLEPGHPFKHALVSAPPKSTCLSCHVGDASIGNGFRGLAQLYPNQPAGPDVPNTTDKLIANQFFVRDPVLTPPDVHHSAGMHCVDCHDVVDVMGDGNIYGAMEHAVGVECVDCHGTVYERASLLNSRGDSMPQLERKGDFVVLRGKVDGKTRRVKQVVDVVDPEHLDYNPEGARAMTSHHGGLECYACHSGWNTNFFGFHFDRNLGFTQLDLIKGRRTDGRVTTQERVFATLRHFTLGVNGEGMIAPYMVGFSTMGTVRGADGEPLPGLDQALPETAAGMSGMSMIHHQTHTTQRAARSCVECHRSPTTWGLGTGDANTSSFALARGYAYAVGESGLDVLLLDRESPDATTYVSRLALGGARRVVVDSHVVTGHAETAFVVIEGAGVTLVDVRNPAFPKVRAFVAAGDAKDVVLAGELLVIANGRHGLRIVDVTDRDQPRLLSDLDTTDARGLAVQWPRVLVADGPSGLLIADLSTPGKPRVSGRVSTAPTDGRGNAQQGDAEAVAAIFQYGRPQGHDERTQARALAVVANGRYGIALVDVTHPERARLLTGVAGAYRNGSRAVDVALTGRFELGDTAGLRPTVERDVAYISLARDGLIGRGQLLVVDVTDPTAPVRLDDPDFNALPGGVALARSFNAPLLVSRLLVARQDGLAFFDATQSTEVLAGPVLGGASELRDIAVEAFAFDRVIDETGRQLKDISHEDARYLSPQEIHRVLSVPRDVLIADRRGDGPVSRATPPTGGIVAGGLLEAGFGDDETEEERRDRRVRGYRLAPEEDLARLVRPLDVLAYDGNGDERISEGELTTMIFDALDANGDGELGPLEWPRHPYVDPSELDRNDDGVVSSREMRLESDVMAELDVDRDGRASRDEWPWAVDVEPWPSLMYASLDLLLDLQRDSRFDGRRPNFWGAFGVDRDQFGKPNEQQLQRRLDQARAAPVIDVRGVRAVGDFLVRWDVDGDGAVEPHEFEPFDRVAERCDVNRDGKIDRRDAR